MAVKIPTIPPWSFPLVNKDGVVERGWTQFVQSLTDYGAAIKALETTVASQATAITDLTSKITALENRVAVLEAK